MSKTNENQFLNKEFRQEVRENPNQLQSLLGLSEDIKVVTSTKETTYIAIPYETDEVELDVIYAAGINYSTAATASSTVSTFK